MSMLLSAEEHDARRKFYAGIFHGKDLTTHQFEPSLWPIGRYCEKISGLTKRRFRNPQKLIRKFPAILGYSFEYIDRQICGLTELGFEDPQELITKSPKIMSYSLRSIDRKLKGLARLGFRDPQKLVGDYPQTLDLSWKIIDRKLKGLARLGFRDPQKLVGDYPQTLGLSIRGNVKKKILGLAKRGFENPLELIAAYPSLLGSGFETIDWKLKLCRRLGVDVKQFIDHTVVFIGMSAKHYIPILRVCRKRGWEPTPQMVSRVYKRKLYLET